MDPMQLSLPSFRPFVPQPPADWATASAPVVPMRAAAPVAAPVAQAAPSWASRWAAGPMQSFGAVPGLVGQGDIGGALGAAAGGVARLPASAIGLLAEGGQAVGNALAPAVSAFGRGFLGPAAPAAAPAGPPRLAREGVSPPAPVAAPVPAPGPVAAAPRNQGLTVIRGGVVSNNEGGSGFSLTPRDLQIMQGFLMPRVSPAEHAGYDALTFATGQREAALKAATTDQERLAIDQQYMQSISRLLYPQFGMMQALQAQQAGVGAEGGVF